MKYVNVEYKIIWGSFTKGADGLLVEQISTQKATSQNLRIHGVIEVKSMYRAKRKVLEQIHRHIMRLNGGVKLGIQEWSPDNIALFKKAKKNYLGWWNAFLYQRIKWKLKSVW